MKRLSTLMAIALVLATLKISAQTENWTTKLNGAIFATPVVQNDTIIVGTESGFLYWISAGSGDIIHEVKIPSPIRSAAVISNNRVYVESMLSLYCFNVADAKEIFTVKSLCADCDDITDPWDYFHCPPVVHNGAIYFVSNKGEITVVDAETGRQQRTITTDVKTEIRGGFTINNETFYFGDNNGTIYGYNLSDNRFTLTIKTFTQRPYPTFGFITGSPLVHKGMLFTGSRHNVFRAFSIKEQTEVWAQTDKAGSWWPTTPIIAGKNVIIGGSDNFKLAAFNTSDGTEAWSVIADYNIFGTPLLLPNAIVFGTGDSYLNRSGNGSVYAVAPNNGELLAKYKPGGNVFSAPVEAGNSIIVCTTTGKMISLKKEALLANAKPIINIQGNTTLAFAKDDNSIKEMELTVSNSSNKPVTLTYMFKLDPNIPESSLKMAKDRDQTYGLGLHPIYLQVNANMINEGTYSNQLVIKATYGKKEETIVKPFTITVGSKQFASTPTIEVNSIEPNEYDCSVNLNLTVREQTKLIGKLLSATDNSLAGVFLQANISWGIHRIHKDIIPINLKEIPAGKYIIILDNNGKTTQYDFEVKPK